MIRRHRLFVALVALSLVVGLAWASPRGRGDLPGSGEFEDGVFLGLASERAGLSEEQREEIHALLVQHREDTAPLREAARDNRVAVARLVIEPEPDEDAIRDGVLDGAAIHGDLAVARSQLLVDIRGVLTPQQQDTLQALLEELVMRIEDGKGPRHCPPRPHRRGMRR